jgi:hypothetical protein
MTRSDIAAALRCCAKKDCASCPYMKYKGPCKQEIMQEAARLIEGGKAK